MEVFKTKRDAQIRIEQLKLKNVKITKNGNVFLISPLGSIERELTGSWETVFRIIGFFAAMQIVIFILK